MISHKKIKELRTLKGLTQIQVAEKLNMPQSNYAKVENGRLNLKGDRLEKLAELLEVSVEELLHATQIGISQKNNERLQELERENENLKKEVALLRQENELQRIQNENFIGIINNLSKAISIIGGEKETLKGKKDN